MKRKMDASKRFGRMKNCFSEGLVITARGTLLKEIRVLALERGCVWNLIRNRSRSLCDDRSYNILRHDIQPKQAHHPPLER